MFFESSIQTGVITQQAMLLVTVLESGVKVKQSRYSPGVIQSVPGS